MATKINLSVPFNLEPINRASRRERTHCLEAPHPKRSKLSQRGGLPSFLPSPTLPPAFPASILPPPHLSLQANQTKPSSDLERDSKADFTDPQFEADTPTIRQSQEQSVLDIRRLSQEKIDYPEEKNSKAKLRVLAGEAFEIILKCPAEFGVIDEDLIDVSIGKIGRSADRRPVVMEFEDSAKENFNVFVGRYRLKLAFVYTISAKIDDVDVKNSPFNISVVPGAPTASTSDCRLANNLNVYLAGVGVCGLVIAKDEYGNKVKNATQLVTRFEKTVKTSSSVISSAVSSTDSLPVGSSNLARSATSTARSGVVSSADSLHVGSSRDIPPAMSSKLSRICAPLKKREEIKCEKHETNPRSVTCWKSKPYELKYDKQRNIYPFQKDFTVAGFYTAFCSVGDDLIAPKLNFTVNYGAAHPRSCVVRLPKDSPVVDRPYKIILESRDSYGNLRKLERCEMLDNFRFTFSVDWEVLHSHDYVEYSGDGITTCIFTPPFGGDLRFTVFLHCNGHIEPLPITRATNPIKIVYPPGYWDP